MHEVANVGSDRDQLFLMVKQVHEAMVSDTLMVVPDPTHPSSKHLLWADFYPSPSSILSRSLPAMCTNRAGQIQCKVGKSVQLPIKATTPKLGRSG